MRSWEGGNLPTRLTPPRKALKLTEYNDPKLSQRRTEVAYHPGIGHVRITLAD